MRLMREKGGINGTDLARAGITPSSISGFSLLLELARDGRCGRHPKKMIWTAIDPEDQQ